MLLVYMWRWFKLLVREAVPVISPLDEETELSKHLSIRPLTTIADDLSLQKCIDIEEGFELDCMQAVTWLSDSFDIYSDFCDIKKYYASKDKHRNTFV